MPQLTEHFSREEFACKCGCGADKVSKELVEKLELVRLMYGKPMRVTSGVRCAFHNQGEGGKKTSAHLQGEAADIAVKDCSERDLLVGFLRTYSIEHTDQTGPVMGIRAWTTCTK